MARLTSLRRDEERSFRSSPFARPYYICAALTADLLAPARGLLAVSTWPMEQRVIGPLSPRVHFLTAAIRVAESILRVPGPDRPPPAAVAVRRQRPRRGGSAAAVDPRAVAQAPRAELQVHEDADLDVRRAAAQRARRQLDDAGQLFGSHLRVTPARPTRSPRSGTASSTGRLANQEDRQVNGDRSTPGPAIRGRALPRSHDARTIAALASNPGCARRAVWTRPGRTSSAWPRTPGSPRRSASRGSPSPGATRSRPR